MTVDRYFVTDGSGDHVVRCALSVPNGWRFETVAGPLSRLDAGLLCLTLNWDRRRWPVDPNLPSPVKP